MHDEIKLTLHSFRCGTDKEAALKPLEEAAEVYAAWQSVDHGWRPEGFNGDVFGSVLMGRLECEIADCIQACVNLADRYGIDLGEAIGIVEQSNRERGRYD